MSYEAHDVVLLHPCGELYSGMLSQSITRITRSVNLTAFIQ